MEKKRILLYLLKNNTNKWQESGYRSIQIIFKLRNILLIVFADVYWCLAIR